jgi:hypothetical protein
MGEEEPSSSGHLTEAMLLRRSEVGAGCELEVAGGGGWMDAVMRLREGGAERRVIGIEGRRKLSFLRG